MTKTHLNFQTLLQLCERKLPYQVEERVLDHLADCSGCRQRLEQLSLGEGFVGTNPVAEGPPSLGGGDVSASVTEEARTEPPVPTIPLPTYGAVLDRAMDSFAGESARLESERSQVGELLRELDGLSPSQQRLVIKNSPRYQTWALAEGLLDACRAGWSDDPNRSETLAELSLDVASCLKPSAFRRQLLDDLKAEAWSYVANCRRIRSDLFAAEEAFRRAWACLATGSGDLGTRAGILDLESSLQRARRNLPEAEKLLSEAISCYRELGDRHREGRALLKVANCLWVSGKLTESLEAIEEGSRLSDAEREPALRFAFRKNRLAVLADLGRLDEAYALVPEVRELARSHASRLDRLRVRWTEARLMLQLGQVEMAEEILRQVREAFIAAEIGYDVALVSLDLATVALEMGRSADVQKLAKETYPLFASRGVHREALAAWKLFRSAADRDAVTVALLDEVAGRIRQTQSTSSLAHS